MSRHVISLINVAGDIFQLSRLKVLCPSGLTPNI